MKTAYISLFNRVMGVRDGDFSSDPNTVLLQPNEQVVRGMMYDPNETPRFRPVEPVTAPRWTAFQFLLRFPEQEREVFRVAALTDGKVADFIQLCGAASEIEATHPLTVAGMAYLVAQGHLTQARADEVLGA